MVAGGSSNDNANDNDNDNGNINENAPTHLQVKGDHNGEEEINLREQRHPKAQNRASNAITTGKACVNDGGDGCQHVGKGDESRQPERDAVD
jgi:hypothetical protein